MQIDMTRDEVLSYSALYEYDADDKLVGVLASYLGCGAGVLPIKAGDACLAAEFKSERRCHLIEVEAVNTSRPFDT